MARPYFMTFIHLFHKAQFHLHSFVYIILRNRNLFHFSLFFFFRSPSPPFPLFFFLLCFLSSSSSTYSSLPLFPFSFPPFTFCFFCFLFPLFPFFLFPSISFTITNSFPSPSSFLLVSSSSNFLSPLFLLCIFSFHAFPPYPSPRPPFTGKPIPPQNPFQSKFHLNTTLILSFFHRKRTFTTATLFTVKNIYIPYTHLSVKRILLTESISP